jgi:hypothetical protein
MEELQTQILIAGGSIGGVAAALAALRLGADVILCEETDWVGGQLTTQAVPPDENPWIDSHMTGCTASYRRFRSTVRDYYRTYYPLLDHVSANPHFNPGQGNVSPLCHEPKIALTVLEAMLAPYKTSRQLRVFYRHRPVRTHSQRDRLTAVCFRHTETGEEITIQADYIIDATELGDLLELSDVEHVIGAESQDQTSELHALEGDPDPLDQQSFSWCFALDYLPDEDHTIERPEEYDFWRGYQADFWPAPQLSWTYPEPINLQAVTRPIFNGPSDAETLEDMWHFRRILYRRHYPEGAFPSDVIIVNWPQMDYWLGPLVGVPDEEKQIHLRGARQLSLSFLYWMQTEAPRLDGGVGYPGLRLRGDLLGTNSLAKAPYIREGRRIQAEFTVLEEHLGVEQRGNLQGAERFFDTVGIGSYRIDLHPSSAGRTYIDITNWPFQIPLGAMIPVRVENLLPGGKNLGTTHITNGCFRLHPIEWNIGEAAGALAAYCLKYKLSPQQVRNQEHCMTDFQSLLAYKLGVELNWPEHLRLSPRVKLDPLGI